MVSIKIVKIPEIGYAYIDKNSFDETWHLYILDESFNQISCFYSDSSILYSIDYLEEDNSLLISGKTYNGEFFLQKLDINGNQQWLSLIDVPYFFSLEVSDDGISIIGSNSTTSWADDLIMIHTNSNGVFQWEQEFDCFGLDDIIFRKVSLINTSDNGYLIGGQIDYSGTGYHDGFVLKTYSDGSIEWLNQYQNQYFPIGAFIEKEDSYIFWDTEGCSMLAVDLSGELLWSHTFEYSDYPNIHKVKELSNGYLINGELNGDSCYFAKINDEGQVSVQNNSIIQQTMTLSNYPNPFNPTTTISFSLNAENIENTVITIYSIKGHKVKKLIDEQLGKGAHSVIWDGTDNNNNPVSSGIYLYRLQTNNLNITRKMLILK